jgi:plastocyanin
VSGERRRREARDFGGGEAADIPPDVTPNLRDDAGRKTTVTTRPPKGDSSMRRNSLLLLICCVAALGVAGCGGDDDGGGDTAATETGATGTTGATGAEGGGGGTIRISADPGGDLAFEQDSVTARAGRNTIAFNNPASIPHDVKVEADGEDIGGTDVITDSRAEATVQLEAGTEYTFYCSVPGHRQAGMEGTLRVR